MEADYEVGRGRPPREWQFRKGQSGNPKGRPRKGPAPDEGPTTYDALLSDALARPLTLVEGGQPRRVSALEAVTARQLQAALQGNRLAANHLVAHMRKLEQQSRAEAEACYGWWRDWLRQAGEMPLRWPIEDRSLSYPHPLDVWLDPLQRTVGFAGPLEPEEAPLFCALAIARDLCLARAEQVGRQGDIATRHVLLADAIRLHGVLAPSLGGPRQSEGSDTIRHRLVAAAMAMLLLSPTRLARHIAVLDTRMAETSAPAERRRYVRKRGAAGATA